MVDLNKIQRLLCNIKQRNKHCNSKCREEYSHCKPKDDLSEAQSMSKYDGYTCDEVFVDELINY